MNTYLNSIHYISVLKKTQNKYFLEPTFTTLTTLFLLSVVSVAGVEGIKLLFSSTSRPYPYYV